MARTRLYRCVVLAIALCGGALAQQYQSPQASPPPQPRRKRQVNPTLPESVTNPQTPASEPARVTPGASPTGTRAIPGAPAGAPIPTTPSGPPATYGGISLNNASLTEVIDMLARQLKINYILDPRVKGGVILNTYGETKNIDTKSLLEAILRINGAGMVKEGELYRIVPLADISHHPLPPEKATDSATIPDDDQSMLNLIFLKYVTSTELMKVLQPFVGENATIFEYAPANLLLVLDSRRNMRRLMELVAMFDDDALANQRVHVFEVKNARPTDIAKELENIVKSISLSEKNSPIKFLPIDRINTILAVAPNPGAFKEVQAWVDKLDVPVKARAGAVTNYVYRVRFGDAQAISCSITALYAQSYGNGFGVGMQGSVQACMMMANAYGNRGAYGAGGGGFGGGFGGGGFGGGFGGGMFGGGMYGGGMFGGGMYGGGMYGGGYGGGMYGEPYGGGLTGATAGGAMLPGAAAAEAGRSRDLTGNYLGNQPGAEQQHMPRIVANPFNNTLLIQATPQEYENIQNLLKDLDVPPRQVLIEAKIYSVDLTRNNNIGVKTQLQQRPSGATTAHSLIGDIGVTTAGAATLSASTLVGQSRELLATVQLQETENKAKLLQAPSVIATDSIPANITVGGSVPTLAAQAASGVTGSITSAITNVSTGVGLNILARVTPSGIVTMVINQQVNDPTPTTSSNIGSPSFSTKSVSTQVTVQDGDTIAIGGIINENSTIQSAGVPLLSRIPFLGAAFGSRSNSKERTELIIFITPHVIYDSNQMSDATDELKSRIKMLRKDVKE